MERTKLAWIRAMRGLSQSQLARLAGVSKRAIEKFEQRERRIDTATGVVIYRLASALEVPMESLMEHDESVEENNFDKRRKLT